jgi:hypothetical protein
MELIEKDYEIGQERSTPWRKVTIPKKKRIKAVI